MASPESFGHLWPVPLLLFLAVDAILHHDGGVLAKLRALLFHLFQHVDHMLGRTIVEASPLPAIALLKFRCRQLMAVDHRGSRIIGLDIERGPAKISRRDEARIHDGS